MDLWCYGPDGVDAVRAALLKGKEVASGGDPNADIKLKLIAPPHYTLITACLDKADGEKRLKAVTDTLYFFLLVVNFLMNGNVYFRLLTLCCPRSVSITLEMESLRARYVYHA